MWERWNGDQMRGDPSMNSYNHYAYGAVADWIYRYAAGVDATPVDAGFHTIDLHPTFDSRLGKLDFSYRSAYGAIKSDWSMQGTHVRWLVTIPPNATGQMPLSTDRARSFMLDGAPLKKSEHIHLTKTDGEMQVYSLESGTYSFEILNE
jgi:alpha-L-rhamnosidase